MKNCITFNFKCPECDEKVEAEFTPARSAPHCLNHDSPKFSDPGDSQETNCSESKCPNCGHGITDDEIAEQGAKECERQKENAEEAAAERHAEQREERFQQMGREE